MAKPPKKLLGTVTPDSPAKNHPPAVDTSDVSRPNIGLIDTTREPGEHTVHPVPEGNPGDPIRQPSVTVSEMPQVSLSPDAARHSITWPADRLHLLIPLDVDSGLLISSDGRIYAPIENEGHFLVEQQPDGRYRIPFDFAPGSPGPFVNRIKDRPLWRFEVPDWLMPDSGRRTHVTAMPASVRQSQTYLDPALAALLTQAEDSPYGIRHDKHRNNYVDTAEGTVMVRKNANGAYQQASAKALHPSGAVFEQVPGTRLWRRKEPQTSANPNAGRLDRRRMATDTDPTPVPIKRPFLVDDTQALTESLISSRDLAPLNDAWRTWGQATRSPLEPHIEIDKLHYRVVMQDINAETRLVYVKHPRFSPDLYDAFEHMLGSDPSLQPKWAVKINERWHVLSNRIPFEMPLTHYISSHFKLLSADSASSLARAMFNQANHSNIINGHGLAALNQTFRFWSDRQNNPIQQRPLADPLTMLSTLQPQYSGQLWLTLPSSLGEGLQRLDFDPGNLHSRGLITRFSLQRQTCAACSAKCWNKPATP